MLPSRRALVIARYRLDRSPLPPLEALDLADELVWLLIEVTPRPARRGKRSRR